MKKLFITTIVAFMAMAGYAQTTFNVRIGGGFFDIPYEFYYDDYVESNGGAAFAFEANIPLGSSTNRFVFSPSLFVVSYLEDGMNFDFPLHFGYKVSLGHGSLFIPKIGLMVGYHTYDEKGYGDGLAFGPSAELAFEVKHFVVAANCYYNIIHECKGAFCTVGYKF